MTTDDKTRDEKLQHDINGEAAKISALSSGKILPFDQIRVIKQVKFTYSPLGKALGKQTKAIEEQR